MYAKTYATVLSYHILAKRIDRQEKLLTTEEYATASRRIGRRRAYWCGFQLVVRTDAGETLELDRKDIDHGGGGRKFTKKFLRAGVRIKMYHHPKDTRPWRFKFLGE